MNALPFLLIPIYTHAIAPSEYGVLELLNRSQELLLLLLSLGMRATLLTLYQMEKGNPAKQRALYSTALLFLLMSTLVLLAPLAIGSHKFSAVLFGTTGYDKAVLIILGSCYFECIFQIAALYLQSELKSKAYVAVFAGRALFSVAVNAWLVYFWHWGLMGILWATLIHTATSAILLAGYTFLKTGVEFDRSLLVATLKFGLPLVPAAFCMFILNNGDRYFLNVFSNKTEIGIYSLGYKFGMLTMSLVLTPFGKIWSVTMVDISRDTNGPRKLGLIATYLLTFSAFCTLGISMAAPILVRVSAPVAYFSAYRLVPVVGAAYIFYSWTVVMDASFYITKKTMYKPLILGLSCAVILPLYYFLIRGYGIMGAAWATVGGFAAFAFFTGFFAQKIYRIQYEYARLVRVFLLAIGFYLLGNMAPAGYHVVGILLRVATVIAFAVALYFTCATPEERAYFLAQARRYLKPARREATVPIS